MKIGKGTGRAARWLLAAVLTFGVSTVAMAQTISSSKHNLGSTGTAGNNKVTGSGATGTAEICVFCHTPHAADVSTVGLPLWNKALPATGTYTVYSSSTMDASRANDGVTGSTSVGSVSLACLSCHDGTQAMDNILNAPGSGGYDATGGGANGLLWTWAATARADADGKMLNAGDSLSMLGTDLTNDHPIGMRYCGGGYTTAAAGSSAGAGDCVDKDFFAPVSAVIAGQRVFWVDSGTVAATRDKADMILFNRTFADATFGPSVECASCHDPHNAANGTFLRKTNAGSAVCLACHNK